MRLYGGCEVRRLRGTEVVWSYGGCEVRRLCGRIRRL